MPIQFPPPKRGNPFDRWQWQAGSKGPQQQIAPNLARVGTPFSQLSLNPGIGSGVRVPVNLRNLGQFYQHGDKSGARLNPAADFGKAAPIPGDVQQRASRTLSAVRAYPVEFPWKRPHLSIPLLHF